MSVDMLVEEYLSTMKEDGELDKFLPELLTAMGHVILSSPQKGVRQSGGDLVSRGKDEDGIAKIFIWVIKCGDIDRAAWSSGEQAVRPTLESVVDVFLSSNLSPSARKLPKKVCIVTNGKVRQEVQQDISGYLASYQQRHGVETDDINGSVLANWTSRYMLDERVLPGTLRSYMRRALANVETPEASIEQARLLVTSLLEAARAATGAAKTRQRKVSGHLRAVALFNVILFGWARQSNNLESAYQIAEFTLLAAWSLIHADDWLEKQWVRRIFSLYLSHYVTVVTAYHNKLEPYYRTHGALGPVLRDSTLVVERVFEEIGRLGTASITLQILSRSPNGELAGRLAEALADKLHALLDTHSVAEVPCYDRHATDISCGMTALLLSGRFERAKVWLHRLAFRLVQALQSGIYAPLGTDSFDDLVAQRHGQLEMTPELFRATTLLPTLALWCCELGCEAEYKVLQQRVLPLLQESTANIWFADENYESLLASPNELQRSGFGTAVDLPESMSDLHAGLPVPTAEMLKLESLRLPSLVFIASRHWQLQIPHDVPYVLLRNLLSNQRSKADVEATT